MQSGAWGAGVSNLRKARNCLLALLILGGAFHAPAVFAQDDPLFDFKSIQNDPLDAKVLQQAEADGVIVEQIEYNGPAIDGKPVRIAGILAYPKGASAIPGVFWSQNGMAPAGDYFPKLYAKKGYFCLNVTLDHAVWNSFAPFDTANPKQANLTRLAEVQMRGITYMTTRPEVDKERIGVAGGSYGSFFATLIAGADPRVKAGVGSNDHWFELPAIFQTFRETAGDKRLAIAVPWGHAGPANMDDQLLNWLDIYLLKNRMPLNEPGPLRIEAKEGKLVGTWDWKGERPIAKAEIVVSYGPARPWHQWIHRAHRPYPAAVAGTSASGEIPYPERGLELHCFAQITDSEGAMCATLPATVKPTDFGLTRPTLKERPNLFPLGGFEEVDFVFFTRSGEPAGTADKGVKHGGEQSTRLAPGQKLPLKLFHVPTRSHKLSLWIRAELADSITIEVQALPPANAQSALVQQLRKEFATPELPVDGPAPPTFKVAVDAGPEWKEAALDCPYNNEPIGGYQLIVTPGKANCWIDDVRFEPLWK